MPEKTGPEFAISPIDGRYADKVKELGSLFSEFELNRHRILVEAEYLIALSEAGVTKSLEDNEKGTLRSLYKGFDVKDNTAIKKIENETNHDVKAVELFIKQKLAKTSIRKILEMVHFGLTSQDVNNLSCSLMLKKAMDDAYFPNLKKVVEKLLDFSEKYKGSPMLAHTHGQPASPTTLGHEFSVFAVRIARLMVELSRLELRGKLTGATGNFNAMCVADPYTDWADFSQKFVKDLGLEPDIFTTQIVPHERISIILQYIARINNVIIDLDRDVWLYISMGYLKQLPKKGETGSSTMPHKVNPIDFENSEGNAELANAMLHFMSDKLQISRLQRDLTDSTVKRNYGVSLAHTLISLKSLLKGLGKIEANEGVMRSELDGHPEVLAEAVQTVLRKLGEPGAYEKLKEFTRGKDMSISGFRDFLQELDIPDIERTNLLSLTPDKYTGMAERLTGKAISKCRKILEIL